MKPKKQFLRTRAGMILYAALSLTSMATMSIGLLILTVLLLFDHGGPSQVLRELKNDAQSRPGKIYYGLSTCLSLAAIASLLSQTFFPLCFGKFGVQVDWPRDVAKLAYFLVPPLLCVGWKRLSFFWRIQTLQIWFMAFGLLSIMGISQFVTGWPRAQPNPLLPGFYHPILFLGHHLSVANIWIFPFFVLLDLTFRKSSKKLGQQILNRKLSYLFLAASLFVLVFSFSRTLWVALPVGLAIWILFQVRTTTTLLILLSSGPTLALLGKLPLFARRLEHPMGIDDRVNLWKANLQFFLERPILGVGLGKNHPFSAAYFQWSRPNEPTIFTGHAHNLYLEILAGLGIVGFIAWTLWAFWTSVSWLKIFRSQKTQPFALGIFCAWIVFFINGLTQVNFWEGKVLHQVMWMTGILLATKRSVQWVAA